VAVAVVAAEVDAEDKHSCNETLKIGSCGQREDWDLLISLFMPPVLFCLCGGLFFA